MNNELLRYYVIDDRVDFLITPSWYLIRGV